MNHSKEVRGTYGSRKTPCSVFVVNDNHGNWYCVEDSKNVNFTYDDIEDGVDVEEVSDVDTSSANKPITTLEELEAFIEDDADDEFKKGGNTDNKHKTKKIMKKHPEVHTDKGWRLNHGYGTKKAKKVSHSEGKHVFSDTGTVLTHGTTAVKGADKNRYYKKGGNTSHKKTWLDGIEYLFC